LVITAAAGITSLVSTFLEDRNKKESERKMTLELQAANDKLEDVRTELARERTPVRGVSANWVVLIPANDDCLREYGRKWVSGWSVHPEYHLEKIWTLKASPDDVYHSFSSQCRAEIDSLNFLELDIVIFAKAKTNKLDFKSLDQTKFSSVWGDVAQLRGDWSYTAGAKLPFDDISWSPDTRELRIRVETPINAYELLRTDGSHLSTLDLSDALIALKPGHRPGASGVTWIPELARVDLNIDNRLYSFGGADASLPQSRLVVEGSPPDRWYLARMPTISR